MAPAGWLRPQHLTHGLPFRQPIEGRVQIIETDGSRHQLLDRQQALLMQANEARNVAPRT